MKQIIIALITIFILASCKNGKDNNALGEKAAADTANYTSVKWLDSIVNFGTIRKGDTIRITFRCLNTGNKPLIITEARPGCGCTVADYTKQPIAPNTQGLVTAFFNTEHINQAHVRKTVIVYTNTTNGKEHFLYFEGDIIGIESNDKIAVPHEMPEKKN